LRASWSLAKDYFAFIAIAALVFATRIVALFMLVVITVALIFFIMVRIIIVIVFILLRLIVIVFVAILRAFASGTMLFAYIASSSIIKSNHDYNLLKLYYILCSMGLIG
jgi:hypothetical protein